MDQTDSGAVTRSPGFLVDIAMRIIIESDDISVQDEIETDYVLVEDPSKNMTHASSSVQTETKVIGLQHRFAKKSPPHGINQKLYNWPLPNTERLEFAKDHKFDVKSGEYWQTMATIKNDSAERLKAVEEVKSYYDGLMSQKQTIYVKSEIFCIKDQLAERHETIFAEAFSGDLIESPLPKAIERDRWQVFRHSIYLVTYT